MLTASITTSQNTQCDRFTINDVTDYSDEATSGMNSRKLTLYKSNGEPYRQPGQDTDEIDWPFTEGNSKVIVGMELDLAFNVVMVLEPSSPQPGSTYVASKLVALSCYTNTALYERGKRQSEDVRYEKNVVFTNDTHRLIIERDLAENAIANEDLESAQLALLRAKKIIDNNRIPY